MDIYREDGAKIFSEMHNEKTRHQIQGVMRKMSNRCKWKIIQKKGEHILELVTQRSCGICILEDILNLSGQSAEQPDVTRLPWFVWMAQPDDLQLSMVLKKIIKSEWKFLHCLWRFLHRYVLDKPVYSLVIGTIFPSCYIKWLKQCSWVTLAESWLYS